MEGNLTKGPILKTLTKLAVPIMASSFLGTLYNITDMAWIGLLGSKAVAGIGVGGMFTWLSQGFASMARMGGQVQVAQCVGRGDKEKAHGYAQAAVQLGKKLLPLHAGQVHLVHEHKSGHMVAPQQPPERLGMALHAIGTADHQHGIIQNLQSALGLGGKIHMAGSVQQGDIRAACCQQCLLGKNSDPTGFFQRVCVQKGVLVIHPAQAADGPGAV